MLPPVAVAAIWGWLYDPIQGSIKRILRSMGLDALALLWLRQDSTTLGAVIVAGIWVRTDFPVLLYLAALQSIPNELYASARTDSATRWQQLWHVTMAGVAGTNVIVLALSVIESCKVFDLIFAMTNGGPGNTTQVLGTWVFVNVFQGGAGPDRGCSHVDGLGEHSVQQVKDFNVQGQELMMDFRSLGGKRWKWRYSSDVARLKAEQSGEPRRRMNIARIAEAAGVSKMTVSRVINDAPGVGEKTRTRIQALLDELDFVPNSTARALATGRVRTIGFVSMTSEISRTVAQTLVSLQLAAKAAGWRIMIVGLEAVTESAVREARQQLRQEAVEVVVATSPLNASRSALQILAADFPTVGIWTPSGSIDSVVAPDNETGGAIATRHLLELGHRSVAHVSGPEGWMATEHREYGWRSELVRAGAEIIPPSRSEAWSPRSGFDAAKRLLTAYPETTAIFAANDTIALGVLRAALELGLSVPRELSVVGYDNSMESGFYSPPLTTIAQRYDELGLVVFNEAMRRIGEDDLVRDIDSTPPVLLLRETTAPPPPSSSSV